MPAPQTEEIFEVDTKVIHYHEPTPDRPHRYRVHWLHNQFSLPRYSNCLLRGLIEGKIWSPEDGNVRDIDIYDCSHTELRFSFHTKSSQTKSKSVTKIIYGCCNSTCEQKNPEDIQHGKNDDDDDESNLMVILLLASSGAAVVLACCTILCCLKRNKEEQEVKQEDAGKYRGEGDYEEIYHENPYYGAGGEENDQVLPFSINKDTMYNDLITHRLWTSTPTMNRRSGNNKYILFIFIICNLIQLLVICLVFSFIFISLFYYMYE